MKAIHNKNLADNKTTYQIIAEKFSTDADYVGKINRGKRIPQRGKGLKIYNELKKYNNK